MFHMKHLLQWVCTRGRSRPGFSQRGGATTTPIMGSLLTRLVFISYLTTAQGRVILRTKPVCEIWYKVSALRENLNKADVPAAQTGGPVRFEGGRVRFEKERGVTEVGVVRGIGHVTIRVDGEKVAEGRLELLQDIAAATIPVFLVKLLPDGISFALRGANADAADELLKKSGHPYEFRRDLAMVSIIAGAMRDLSGVMAIIYEALVEEKISVRQTGDAYNAVHCLIPGADAERAATALRKRFDLPAEPETPQQTDGVGLKSL